jgi:hypothetical protein
MERLLAQIGRERRSEETPLEFVRNAGFTAITLPVVNAYYRVRFGAVELTDAELRGIRSALDQLENQTKLFMEAGNVADTPAQLRSS